MAKKIFIFLIIFLIVFGFLFFDFEKKENIAFATVSQTRYFSSNSITPNGLLARKLGLSRGESGIISILVSSPTEELFSIGIRVWKCSTSCDNTGNWTEITDSLQDPVAQVTIPIGESGSWLKKSETPWSCPGSRLVPEDIIIITTHYKLGIGSWVLSSPKFATLPLNAIQLNQSDWSVWYYLTKEKSGANWIYSLDYGKNIDSRIENFSWEESNVSGWAWSENIGWISFLGYTYEDGGIDTVKYSVNIDGDPLSPNYGKFSGYAWSEHIGWIQFDPPGDFITYPGCGYPSSPCQPAKLDLTSTGTVCGHSGWVCGWARALVDGGDWDGWIKLRCFGTECTTSDYGVWLDTSITPHEFRGFAWGSDVVGWVSFNCKNCENNPACSCPNNPPVCNNPPVAGACGVCGVGCHADYKVITSLLINFRPYVKPGSATITGESYCENSPIGQISIQWIYKDDDGDIQSQYNFQVAIKDFYDPTFNPSTDVILDYIGSQTIPSGGTGTSDIRVVLPLANPANKEIPYTGNSETRYWQVRVRSDTGNTNWSDWEEGQIFTIPAHPYPYVDFNHCPEKPTASGIIQFCSISDAGGCDGTTCAPPSPQTTCYDDADITNDLWQWDFRAETEEEEPGSKISNNPNPTYSYSNKGTYQVQLRVTDSTGYSCPSPTYSVYVEVELPLPQWKEIPPTF